MEDEPKIEICQTELLSNYYCQLKKITFNYNYREKTWNGIAREVYDRGNGAAILLYNTAKNSVILTRQFRIPTYLSRNKTGMMIEACAGLLDTDNPEQCAIREVEEETGYRISALKKVFKGFTSPGYSTEILHCFVGEYNQEMKVSNGGGLSSENEHIQVLELPFSEAYSMIESGEIQDLKTTILLQYARINIFV